MIRRHPLPADRPLPTRPTVSARGMSLVELMIALAIVGLLAAVALPSFNDAIRKSRRSEAMQAMVQIQQAQERRRANSPSYTTDLAMLSIASTTPSGRYELSVIPALSESAEAELPLGTSYTAMAYGKAGTSQASDAQCRRMAVRVAQGNLTFAGCGSCASFAFNEFVVNHPCWAQ
jgi:type IV pilus assembly protein PilE